MMELLIKPHLMPTFVGKHFQLNYRVTFNLKYGNGSCRDYKMPVTLYFGDGGQGGLGNVPLQAFAPDPVAPIPVVVV